MKNKLWNRLIILTLAGIVLQSCQKEDETTSSIVNDQISLDQKSGMLVLGKQLENPYSVTNMKKALESLKLSNSNTKSLVNNINIEATHLYIKFIPKTENELLELENNSMFDVYDYPLDYEIKEKGHFYIDPEVPSNQPTYQYGSVKVNQELPKIEYKIISELFIPEEYDNQYQNKNISPEALNLLVEEALRITNNTKTKNHKNRLAKRKKWRPAGRIRVWDDNLSNWVGVEGVEVKARRWFTTHKGITNSSGNYSCDGTFKRDANYSLKWEREDFTIRDKALSGAGYNGPKKNGNWDLNIKDGGQEFYATIFRASYHYYYKGIKSLRKPPLNGILKTKLKIRAFNEQNDDTNGSHCAACRFLGLGSAIRIYNPQRRTRDIYGTVIHELAHASHWNMDRSNYNKASTIVVESWARGVQWELTRMVYSNYRPPYFTDYTGVVEDMVDGIGIGITRPSYDQVSGYTIRQIEDALNGERNWTGWRVNIENRYNNATEGNLEALFNYWD